MPAAAVYDQLVAHVSAAERRPQLIRAAIDVMRRDGVAAASTRAIAAELGIAQATVHYVFGTKDELNRAVIEHLTAQVGDHLRTGELPADASFRTAVTVFVDRLWQTVLDQSEVHELLTELVLLSLRSPTLRGTIADYQRQLDDAVAHWLERATARSGTEPARPIADAARLLAAGLDGLILQRFSRRDDEADQRTLADLIDATVALAEGRLDTTSHLSGVGAVRHRTA
jgi:AcrR family transcriptional regulator